MATSELPAVRGKLDAWEERKCSECPPRQPRSKVCANDLVKQAGDGSADWKTLGNIITADLLGQVLCASYADFKYGRRSKDFKPAIEWEFSYERNDVLVFTKQSPARSNSVCFLARSVIDLPVCVVAAFIHNIQNYPQWNKFMTESRIAQLLSESDCHRSLIGYFCHEMKKFWFKGKRDLCLFMHSSFSVDKYIHAAISIQHQSCPQVKNITRAECFLGSGWVVEPYEGKKSKSLISYVSDIDLKGHLPPSIMKTFLEKQPMAVHYLRASITEQMKSQRPRPHPRRVPTKAKPVTTSDDRVDDAQASPLRLTGSLDSVDFGADALASFVSVSIIAKQYEDPVGLSEFVGHKATPNGKRSLRRRHQCCGRSVGELSMEVGAKNSCVVSDDMCANCAMAGGTGHRNGVGNRTRYTCT